MSRRVQKNAKERADAARERERSARERARRSEARGDRVAARLHRNTAELHADAAANADTLIELDQEIEGDQLDNQPAGPTPQLDQHHTSKPERDTATAARRFRSPRLVGSIDCRRTADRSDRPARLLGGTATRSWQSHTSAC